MNASIKTAAILREGLPACRCSNMGDHSTHTLEGVWATSVGLLFQLLRSFAPLLFGMSSVVMEAHRERSADIARLRSFYNDPSLLYGMNIFLLLAVVTHANIQQLMLMQIKAVLMIYSHSKVKFQTC